jgi:Chromate resistance exported protein
VELGHNGDRCSSDSFLRTTGLRIPALKALAPIVRGGDTDQRDLRLVLSRKLIHIWVGKYEAGAVDEDIQAADLLQVLGYGFHPVKARR